jgi:hypothetical protein
MPSILFRLTASVFTIVNQVNFSTWHRAGKGQQLDERGLQPRTRGRWVFAELLLNRRHAWWVGGGGNCV